MATLQTIVNYARPQAQTDSNGLTDAKAIIFANEAKIDFRRKLITHGVDASQIQEAYSDGTADVGTYLYPTDMFFLKAIECNFTDTTNSNYITASQIDVSNLTGDNSFSWLRTNQSILYPKFDDRGDWFEIFPTPLGSNNLTRLFRIFYFLEPTEWSALSDTVAYPESLNYQLLAWRIVSDYYYSLGKIQEGVAFNQKYEEGVEQLIKTLGRGVQTPMQAVPIQDTGWTY